MNKVLIIKKCLEFCLFFFFELVLDCKCIEILNGSGSNTSNYILWKEVTKVKHLFAQIMAEKENNKNLAGTDGNTKSEKYR